jgi:hypothetical protein
LSAAPAGLRALWPRLAAAAAATLLLVVAVGFALARWAPLPPRSRPQTVPSEPVASAPPAAEKLVPAPPRRDPPSAPPLAAPAPEPPRALGPDLPGKPPALTAPPTTPAKRPETAVGSDPDRPSAEPFYQEVVISRLSRYRILGADLTQNVRYVLVSRFRVTKEDADGSLHVEQKVEGVRLADADPALQAQLNDLLQKTKGATFTMTLNPRREVTRFEGGREALHVFGGGNPLTGPSFLLWSFLDRDGWKELAQLSFFRPPGELRRGEKWSRPMTHSWGPLGSWAGRAHYQYAGRPADLDRFDYALELAYRPPGKGGGLPFRVTHADFQVQAARGAIAFHPGRGRVSAAEERFHVKGALAVDYLGAGAAVEMDEVQLFQLRLHDRNPLDK